MGASHRMAWVGTSVLLPALLAGCVSDRTAESEPPPRSDPTTTTPATPASSPSRPAESPPAESPPAESPPAESPPAEPDPRGKNHPPFVGDDMAEWEQFWEAGNWQCADRPAFEEARTVTCTQRDDQGADMIDINTTLAGEPGSLMALTATADDQLERRWQELITSLEPIIGTPTVEQVLDSGDGRDDGVMDPLDVATQPGFRAVFAYDRTPAGANQPDIDLTSMITKVEKAGGECDRYQCVGPANEYQVRFGVGTTTSRLLTVSDPGTPMTEVWGALGAVGEDVQELRALGTPYVTGVVGRRAAVRTLADGQEIILLADSGGRFRGRLPDGERPPHPTTAPTR